MNSIFVKNNNNKNDFLKKTPKENDYSNLISDDATLLNDDGDVVAVYGKLDSGATNSLRLACESTKYTKGSRTGGMKTQSVIFGFAPRNPVRQQNDICRATGLVRTQPKVFVSFSDAAFFASEILKKSNPDQHAKQCEYLKQNILNEWILDGGAFTSGIVNKDNPLQYHYDSGNVKNSWSVMVCFKRKTIGGNLILPEYDLALEMADNTFIAFSGAKTLHGVSPIIKSADGYRFSIVWYPLEQMKKCLCANDEIKRFRNIRQAREKDKERMLSKK